MTPGYLVTVTPGGPNVVDLGGPDGGRYWRIVSALALDHEDVRSAAVNGRLTGSVGCTYNEAEVERVEVSRQTVDTLDEVSLAAQEAVGADALRDTFGDPRWVRDHFAPFREPVTIGVNGTSISVERVEDDGEGR